MSFYPIGYSILVPVPVAWIPVQETGRRCGCAEFPAAPGILDVVLQEDGDELVGVGAQEGEGGEEAVDTCVYNTAEVERIVHQAFQIAEKRRKKLASVDKANVLETSRLWRETVNRIAPQYPDVELEHVLVDNCAMQLLRRPSSFDVIVTENMFGDILSDEAAMLTGSIGMLASASMGEGSYGLYEPVHGSAPDIAGQGLANPIATILSVALMYRLTFGYADAADAIERAVAEVLDAGHRTADIAVDRSKALSTTEMGDLIAQAIRK